MSVTEITAFLTRLEAEVKAQTAAVRKTQRAAWKDKLASEVQNGTGWAHRITKPQEEARLNFATPSGGCDLLSQLQGQEDTWRTWWQCDAELPQGDF
jgi:hypothetical protein